MKSFYSFMQDTVLSSKSELRALIIDLDTIRQNVNLIQKAIPAAPGEYKIHDRLNTIRTKALSIQELIQKAIE